jgi:hypothetical protein
VLSLIASTIVFFVASYFIKRYLDRIDIPKSMTRSLVIFCLALALSYGVAVLVDFLAS